MRNSRSTGTRQVTGHGVDQHRAVRGPCPAQRGGHRDRVEAAAVLVLRRLPVLALVAARGPAPAEVVPRRGLMPAPGREPVGERHEDDPPWPGHPHHLGKHRAPVTDVFEHVGGEADIDGAGGERKAQRGADGAAGLRPAQGRQFPAVGVHAHRPGTCASQLPDEEAGPAADIGHDPAVQSRVLAELADGVAGEGGAVGGRGCLLGAERAEQAGAAGHISPEWAIGHLGVLASGAAGGRRARAGGSRRRRTPAGSPRPPGWTARRRRSPARSRSRPRSAHPRAAPA